MPQVHDSCWPFEILPGLTPQQVKGVRSAALPGLLTRSAQAAVAAMVQQYHSAAASAAVQFVLHGGDGVALCAAGGSLGDDTRFHAIDCSNVGDHAGEIEGVVRGLGLHAGFWV
jgi:hypothetical protein